MIACASTLGAARELISDAVDEWLAARTSTERATIGSQPTRVTLALGVA